MSKIVIMESLGISAEELAARKAPFEAQGHVFVDYPKTTDPAKLIEEAKDADAMIIANMSMPAELCASVTNSDSSMLLLPVWIMLVWIFAKEKNIAVSNASGYSNEAVSELVIGTTLSLARNLRSVEDQRRVGKDKTGLVGWEIKGKTVGIIGLGKIGTRTAELFHAFGADILAQSRSRHENAKKLY